MVTLANLSDAVKGLGKPAWRSMLAYVAYLHAEATHAPHAPLPYAWEEIGPGYCYGPAFGHWDLVHQVLDVVRYEPEHARRQLLNNLAAQAESGFLPGAIWMPREDDPTREQPRWSPTVTHPPVWPVAVQAYADVVGDTGFIARSYEALVRQIRWFEAHRRADPEGFYYTDILSQTWESGVDEGVRFQSVQSGPFACVDATAHVFALYTFAEAWGAELGTASGVYGSKAARLREFIREELFSEETGFFHDRWAVDQPEQCPMALEGMWPVVVGAATPEQANRVIDENLLNPRRFYALHPVTTVAVDDPAFELRMWRGPTWNSLTYWAARGCLRYGHTDAARALLEPALDQTASQFERTGTIWEFYHPQGGPPESVQRKPHTPYNRPCSDYLGHNPLIAMAQMYADMVGA